MKRERFHYLYQVMNENKKVRILHVPTNESGILVGRIKYTDLMVVQIFDRGKRCWDFHECEELRFV